MPNPSVGLADRMFFSADAVLPQHVAALGTFAKPDGAPSDYVPRLFEQLRTVRTVAAPLNYVLARPALKAIAPAYRELADDEIDLDAHLRLHRLTGPGRERKLGELVSTLHSQPLDMTRPLWEFDLIDGLDGDRFALYFKVHHALMDGVAGSRRLAQMVGPDPDDSALRPLWAVGPPRARQADGRPMPLVERVRRIAGAVAAGGRTAGGLAKAGVGMVTDRVRPPEPDLAVPFRLERTVLNQRIGTNRRIATQNVDFDRIRAVAKAARVTVNDVFLAIAAGGLRRYLAEIDTVPSDSLVAGTPVDVRVEGEQGKTNAFTMTVMKLCTDIDDPVARLKAINRSSKLAKSRLSQLPGSVAANYAALFMGPFVLANMVGLAGRVRPPYHVSVSNVPGPVAPQYWAGARLEAMYPVAVPYHGAGLFIASLTVSGRFCIGIVGDADTLPHLQHLALYMGEAMDELEGALT